MISSPFGPLVMTDHADSPQTPRLDAGNVRPSESSIELLLQARDGNADALERLCARYLPRLKRWGHGRLPSSSRGLLETDDLAQEILIRAVGRIGVFEPRAEGAFQAYVRQMLLNRLRDEGRRGRRRPASEPIPDDQAAENPSPLEIAIGREGVEQYEAALDRLKPTDRELIIARIEFGFTAAEIAESLGKPTAAAAQMAVSRALLRLAEEMARG